MFFKTGVLKNFEIFTGKHLKSQDSLKMLILGFPWWAQNFQDS